MRKKNKKHIETFEEKMNMIGANLSFSASEAYKLLRTNLNFSLPDENGCKIIGITSALRGEGKTTTAINTAYSIAQAGKKVLLLEADLRLPNIGNRLNIKPGYGLSNFLAGHCKGGEILQQSSLMSNLWVIPAGDVPPNPAELLGSAHMGEYMKALVKGFDMVIVDLPPVSEVSDALIMSKLLSGMVLVVRQDYCNKKALDETVNQLKFADTNILGFVLTDSKQHEKDYKRKGYYYKEGYYR